VNATIVANPDGIPELETAIHDKSKELTLMGELHRIEYAVEVEGLGFLCAFGDRIEVGTPEEKSDTSGVFHSQLDADQAAAELRARYKRLGADEVAKAVYVSYRSVHEQRTGFAPMVGG
jgi:hypothetical protein